MGTNFYLHTTDKSIVQQYAPYSYELTDEPEFGYVIHIAKTSSGWLPLFQGHDHGINSVAGYKAAYDTGKFKIYDEYGVQYDWDSFDDRVLKFNGGIRGVQMPYRIWQNKAPMVYDPNLPEYGPISHIGGNIQSYKYDFAEYADDYFVDPDGFEFDRREFS